AVSPALSLNRQSTTPAARKNFFACHVWLRLSACCYIFLSDKAFIIELIFRRRFPLLIRHVSQKDH
ncbi:MAG TPA: hypothetical protein PKY10_13300, partial [Lentisphaeria bacterium]|nr:hypothetical protein [Lentisphaeria bacterium]